MDSLKLLYMCGLTTLALLIFLNAFFPLHQTNSTIAIKPPKMLNDLDLKPEEAYKRQIDRLILIVIDALRTDFVTNEHMPFLTTTASTDGCTTRLKVETPTVTLPRIKALTTGSIPQFIDVIRNLASTDAIEDSFLHEAKNVGKKIVFYGDNTWVKLYPNLFERYEEVSSFYVNDYAECDENVTRNVAKELGRDDWDIMVLHYLGLDHIGHVYGPFSALVSPKLGEMDAIIKTIYVNSPKNTLIAVTGDHGMKDSRGHGGATISETYVPFVTLGITCTNSSAAQTDVPATLATLFGLMLPKNSVGRLITNLLSGTPMENILYALYYNNLVLRAKLPLCDYDFEQAKQLHYDYLRDKNESNSKKAWQLYEACGGLISEKLVHASVEQNLHNLLVASALLILCSCIFLQDVASSQTRRVITGHVCSLVIIVQIILPQSYLVTTGNLCVLGVFIFKHLKVFLKLALRSERNVSVSKFVTLLIIFHLISLTSSSYIEEEHQTWYYFWVSLGVLNAYTARHGALPNLLLTVASRFLRRLNQTGDKWAHLPDFSQWLLGEDNYMYLQAIFVTSLILIWIFLPKSRRVVYFSSVILLGIFIIRLHNAQLVTLAQIIWVLIVLNLVLSANDRNVLVTTWVLICALVMRPYNVILIPACLYASSVLCKHVKDAELLVVSHLWLGNVLFFCQGHSNSFASVDVAAGYVGLKSYIPFLVIVQVLCHTYAFPVLTNLLLLRHCYLDGELVWAVNASCRLLILTTVSLLTLFQRHHLFVWTVFAPKLLIESSHFAILLLQIIIYCCIVQTKRLFVQVRNKTT